MIAFMFWFVVWLYANYVILILETFTYIVWGKHGNKTESACAYTRVSNV